MERQFTSLLFSPLTFRWVLCLEWLQHTERGGLTAMHWKPLAKTITHWSSTCNLLRNNKFSTLLLAWLGFTAFPIHFGILKVSHCKKISQWLMVTVKSSKKVQESWHRLVLVYASFSRACGFYHVRRDFVVFRMRYGNCSPQIDCWIHWSRRDCFIRIPVLFTNLLGRQKFRRFSQNFLKRNWNSWFFLDSLIVGSLQNSLVLFIAFPFLFNHYQKA